MKRILATVLTIAMVLCLFTACVEQSGDSTPTTGTVITPTTTVPTTTVPTTTAPADPWAEYECLTIADVIELCQQAGTTETAEKYYIRGTITEISNEKYGNMTVSDARILCLSTAHGPPMALLVMMPWRSHPLLVTKCCFTAA